MERIHNEVVSYAILGAGEHAFRAHAEPAKSIPGLNLVGLFDPNQASIDRFQADYGRSLTIFKSEDELLASSVDVVLIASPDQFHIQSLSKAINAGKHILIEKPLAIDQSQIAQLRDILTSVRLPDLVVTSCHPRRFDPPFLWLRQHLPALRQNYGDVLNFNFDFSYHEPSLEWKHDRSLLLDHANHEIDLVHFLFGITNFEARMLHDSFDRYQVIGKRADGIIFDFMGTRRLRSEKYTEYAFIRFDRADLRLDTKTGLTFVTDHETDKVTQFQSGATDYNQRFVGVMRNFVDTIQGKVANYLSPEDLWINNWFGVELTTKGRCNYEPTSGH